MTLSRRFNRDVNNIAEGCISNIITGYYDLYVYDVENDHTLSQLPAIIKNQVFVDEQTTTTTTSTTTGSITTTGIMTTTSSVSTALSPTIPSTNITTTATPTEGTTDETLLVIYISVSVCFGVVILLLTVIIIIIIISVLVYKKRNRKDNVSSDREKLHPAKSAIQEPTSGIQNAKNMSENKNPDTSTPEDNKNDIPLRELSQTSPKRTPSITPPTTPPPPSNLSSSSQVSQSGNIPDKIRYPQDEFKKGSTKEELVNPGHTESKSGTSL